LEGLIQKVIIHIGRDDTCFDAVFKQISVNDNIELQELKKKRDELSGNVSRVAKEIDNLTRAMSGGISEASRQAVYSRLDHTTASKAAIDGELASIKVKIEMIEEQSISKAALKKRYSEFAEVFEELPKEKKRKLVQTIIKEISCQVKKREDKGQIRISFWGDGTILKDWDTKRKPRSVSFEVSC
jgi:hypothetical protein